MSLWVDYEAGGGCSGLIATILVRRSIEMTNMIPQASQKESGDLVRDLAVT